MSQIEQNLPDALDRLGLLLDHAHGMAMAATGEDFPNINARALLNFNDALLHVVLDARAAYDDLVLAQMPEHLRQQVVEQGRAVQ